MENWAGKSQISQNFLSFQAGLYPEQDPFPDSFFSQPCGSGDREFGTIPWEFGIINGIWDNSMGFQDNSMRFWDNSMGIWDDSNGFQDNSMGIWDNSMGIPTWPWLSSGCWRCSKNSEPGEKRKKKKINLGMSLACSPSREKRSNGSMSFPGMFRWAGIPGGNEEELGFMDSMKFHGKSTKIPIFFLPSFPVLLPSWVFWDKIQLCSGDPWDPQNPGNSRQLQEFLCLLSFQFQPQMIY